MSEYKNIYYIFHGRFPSEKAAALFVAESARSFAAHAPVTILVPRRFGRGTTDAYEFFQLPSSIRIQYLPTIDLFRVPFISHAAFIISYVCFSLSCFFFFLFSLSDKDMVISNEPLPLGVASYFTKYSVIEVHDFPESFQYFYNWVFSHARVVLTTNLWKEKKLKMQFPNIANKVYMERNGVDLTFFGEQRTKEQCRTVVGLPQGVPIVMYTGHLYAWKGVTTLAEAAKSVPEALFVFVGGTSHDQAKFKEQYGKNNSIRIIGQVPHKDIPLWQGSADILALPNSGREEISEHYTSPMKLFEYMASERPIVASNISSITEVIDESCSYLFFADTASDLARAIQEALHNPVEALHRAHIARERVMGYTWSKRAVRILERI